MEEVALGREFFTRRDGLEQRLLPGMPTCRDPQGWATQHVLWLEDVACLADQLLSAWRGYLPGSRMVALLGAYADQIRPAVPLADRLTRAWLNDPQRPAVRSHEETLWWEDWHFPRADRQRLDESTQRMIVIGAVLVTAVAQGDVGRY